MGERVERGDPIHYVDTIRMNWDRLGKTSHVITVVIGGQGSWVNTWAKVQRWEEERPLEDTACEMLLLCLPVLLVTGSIPNGPVLSHPGGSRVQFSIHPPPSIWGQQERSLLGSTGRWRLRVFSGWQAGPWRSVSPVRFLSPSGVLSAPSSSRTPSPRLQSEPYF